MEVVVDIIAVVLGIVGIIGSIAPGLPGPPLSWAGILLMYFWGGTNGSGEHMSLTLLLVLLGVTILVTGLDYVVPGMFTKWTGGSRWGAIGCTIGLIIGIFLPQPWGIIIGACGGAFIGEIVFAQKDAAASLKSAIGSFLGFLFGTGIKLIASGAMMYYIIVYI
ncbi:MAG: DUF456 domain-containing protein [Bacteroidales bacterium]|jgi:uncharacterized protein YqgC (DUF456 family)|nr:DUF456 domain-containing protein [Bacteroidales bacterium]MDY2936120.1 DUF456 domain-containing protein [Candidatus Cryptobacteroides sp.]MCH3941352.1 DUF456 domain-containing protein [Bacteroidales bacterium]MCI5719788.1 DUF456 domain-containing protein [Bacteroidales bacterium]MDD7088132.1 DUF456 domain-containing protein [Bacteroidales bacterium]